MRARLRAMLDGAGWAVGLAAAVFAFALVVLALELQSPDVVLWTGQQVTGIEQGGLAYFHWHGRTYATAVSGSGSGQRVTVYFDPANPLNAMADNPADRALTGLLIGGPAVAGTVILAAGLTRRTRWARRQRRAAAAGGPPDPEVFSRLLAQRRGEHPGGRTG